MNENAFDLSRVIRGCSFNSDPEYLRSANSYGIDPAWRYSIVGFRLIRLTKKEKNMSTEKSSFNDSDFVNIKPGKFMMGSPESEKDRFSDERYHEVEIKEGFAMQKTHVTQAQWKAVMGNNPSHFQGDDLPVECVSWNDCQEFIKKLNELDPGKGYRLPNEEEYEYCTRAGTTTAYFFGDTPEKLDEYAWYWENSKSKTHPVSTKKPNPWGLFDMIGNVWSWCQDVYK